MADKCAIYSHPASLTHDTGPHHPENVKRIEYLNELIDEPLFDCWDKLKPRAATQEEICRAHTLSYYKDLYDSQPEHGLIMLDSGDTIMSPDSFEAATYAAGAVCQACDDVLSGKHKRAFCMNRPPGHHAEPYNTMGFCLFNNVFIGAMQAKSYWGLNKIAIIDFDVHHGNGTDTMARSQTGIFFASSHEYPLYPGTGNPNDNIKGHVENYILQNGEGSREFRDLYQNYILPSLEENQPEIIFISAGFDGHEKDSISHLNLKESDYQWVTREIVKIANKSANGNVISVLEGGYHLQALCDSTRAHLLALAET